MKIKGKKFYNCILIISILLVLAVLASVFFLNRECNTISRNNLKNYSSDWNYKGEKITLPCRLDHSDGKTVEISKILPETISADSHLFFLTENKGIIVYVDDKKIYSCADKKNYLYGDNLGMAYTKVPLIEDYAGKEIVIKFIPKTAEKSNFLSEINMGNTSSIILSIFNDNAVGLFISILIFLLSLFFLIQSIVFRKRKMNVDSLLYLSISGIIYAFWTGASSMIWQLFYGNTLFMYYLLCLSFLIMPIPLMLCVRSLFKNVNNSFLNVMIMLSFINLIVCIVLDLFDIKKLNDTFFTTHIIIILTVFILVYMFIKRSFKEYEGIKFVFMFFLITAILDIGRYYITSTEKTPFFSRIGILVFLFFLGKQILYNLLYEIQTNKKYKDMAYKDSLTDAFSWVALTEKVRAIKNIRKCSIALFDLNDLKYYNDTYGHMAGDKLITNSVKFIKDAFKDWGSVFRIGGDEFLVLMNSASKNDFNLCIEKLLELTEEYNSHNTVQMNIAYGFATYEDIDDNFETIKNRADKEMYAIKRKLKKGDISWD